MDMKKYMWTIEVVYAMIVLAFSFYMCCLIFICERQEQKKIMVFSQVIGMAWLGKLVWPLKSVAGYDGNKFTKGVCFTEYLSAVKAWDYAYLINVWNSSRALGPKGWIGKWVDII